MATQPKTSGLTYEDLRAFPDDNLRREIIDGDLYVTPSPVRRVDSMVTVAPALTRCIMRVTPGNASGGINVSKVGRSIASSGQS